MKTIHKFQLNVGLNSIYSHAVFKPLCVQIQSGMINMWAEVDESEARVNFTVRVYGTGFNLTVEPQEYIGTVQIDGYAWHAYLETPQS